MNLRIFFFLCANFEKVGFEVCILEDFLESRLVLRVNKLLDFTCWMISK